MTFIKIKSPELVKQLQHNFKVDDKFKTTVTKCDIKLFKAVIFEIFSLFRLLKKHV